MNYSLFIFSRTLARLYVKANPLITDTRLIELRSNLIVAELLVARLDPASNVHQQLINVTKILRAKLKEALS